MEERNPHTKRIDDRTFSIVRKGFDPREVKTYLEDLEHAFQDIEGHSRRTSQKVVELERDLAAARASENSSLDSAMLAVFDVKDRMIDRAERKARDIAEQANKQASSLLAEATQARGQEPELQLRIGELERDVVQARADGERMRMQLNDAHAALDQIEATSTVDITSLQAQLKHEQQQTSELRAQAREVDWVKREYDHKLAQAQEQAMRARAEAESIRAELEALQAGTTQQATGDAERHVVYERVGEVADYEVVVAAMEEEQMTERLSQAM